MAKEMAPGITPEEIDAYKHLGIDSLLKLLRDLLDDPEDFSPGEERQIDKIPTLIKEIENKYDGMNDDEKESADILIAQAEGLLNNPKEA